MANRADKRKFHYIYKITRFDGKYYIGMHSTDDLEDGYFGSGQRLWHSLKYHGKEKHSMEILEFLPSRQALKERERELVNAERLKDSLCLNLVEGGGGPGDFSRESKEKMKDAWSKERKDQQAERLRAVTKKRFEHYWDTHLTPAEKLQEKRKAEGWVQPNRSEIAKKQWAKMNQEDREAAKASMSSASKGKVPIINPQGQIKRVFESDLQPYLDDGWIRGMTLTPSKETLRKKR